MIFCLCVSDFDLVFWLVRRIQEGMGTLRLFYFRYNAETRRRNRPLGDDVGEC